MTLSITKLSKAAGAEIKGLDLSSELKQEDIDVIKQAWLDHMVLLVRDGNLSEEGQERFCSVFGQIAGLKSKRSSAKFLFVANKEVPEQETAVQLGEMMFHYDQAYSQNPCKASTLYSIMVPEMGGNTCFSNCCAVYERLSAEWKKRIKGKTALNYFNYDTDPSKRPKEIDPNAPQYSHPIIRTHPETGRKSIYVNRLMTMKINGVKKGESKEILEFLFSCIEDKANIYEHIWTKGDLVLWDNRCTAHARTHYNPQKARLLRRMTILDENSVQ